MNIIPREGETITAAIERHMAQVELERAQWALMEASNNLRQAAAAARAAGVEQVEDMPGWITVRLTRLWHAAGWAAGVGGDYRVGNRPCRCGSCRKAVQA